MVTLPPCLVSIDFVIVIIIIIIIIIMDDSISGFLNPSGYCMYDAYRKTPLYFSLIIYFSI
jgi:hypothetical protein